MSSTLGFYLIKKCLQKYKSWPTNQPFSGLGALILVALNMVWTIYNSVLEFTNYQTNIVKCLILVHFISLSATLVTSAVQALRYPDQLIEMFNILSDFNQFGIPQKLETVERKLKNVFKLMNYGTYFSVCFMSYLTLFDDNCGKFKTTKHCLVFEYYLPFGLKPWNLTLLMLFQIFSMKVTLIIIAVTILMYCYSMELLIGHIEHLNEKISNVILTRHKKRNLNLLRPIIMYYQDICRMFQFCNKLYIKLIVPQKLLALSGLTMSTTAFVLEKDVTSFLLASSTWIAIFLLHMFGQKLTTAGQSVANAIYNMNWYDADEVTRKQVLTLLCLSQHPLTIRLPLFGEMSHAAALKELKKVYLYINSLATMTKSKQQ